MKRYSKPNIHSLSCPYDIINSTKAKRQSQIAAKVSLQAYEYASMIAYYANTLVLKKENNIKEAQ